MGNIRRGRRDWIKVIAAVQAVKNEALRRLWKQAASCALQVHTWAGRVTKSSVCLNPTGKSPRAEMLTKEDMWLQKMKATGTLFKVPILRNVEMTSPYFHDGSVDGLHDAVWVMGKVQLGRDLPRSQAEDIVLFLRSLTGGIPDDTFRISLLPSME